MNPFHHLGALAIYCFWVTLVTGIYLFLFYETSLTGAWLSVERLTHEQWYAGGVMRSLHRYASAAAVFFILLHVLREFTRGRFRGPRWFSWVTGVPVVWVVIIFGITGYWMVWDELAQYIAVSSARLMDWLPIFTDPMSRNFLTNDDVSNRFFTLIAFIHLVGLPIILVLGLWFHMLRIRMPRINPPRAMMAACMAVMLLVSVLFPATSHAPADLSGVPSSLNVDWLYLAVYPLMDATSEGFTWSVLFGGTLVMTATPWIPAGRKPAIAVVHLPDCTGCGFCADDCPYGAINMLPRSDSRNFTLEARVDNALCVGCGICTGSCPSSSLFRRQQPLATGIDLPAFPIDALKRRILALRESVRPRVLLFGCDHAVEVEHVEQDGVTAISLPCTGMLPPAAIDFALRNAGYDGVIVSGCEAGDCFHRYGDEWTRARLARERQPMLRTRVPRDRIMTQWLGAGESGRLAHVIDEFQVRLGDGL